MKTGTVSMTKGASTDYGIVLLYLGDSTMLVFLRGHGKIKIMTNTTTMFSVVVEPE